MYNEPVRWKRQELLQKLVNVAAMTKRQLEGKRMSGCQQKVQPNM